MSKNDFKDRMNTLIELSLMPESTPDKAPFSMYFAGMLISARVSMPEEFKKAVVAFNAFEEEQAEEQMLEQFLDSVRKRKNNLN